MRQNMFNTPPLCNFLSFKSITYLTLLFGICFISLSVWAGGSIFGSSKHKTSNPNGVYSIGVHICSSLECPDIRIISGTCDGEHMEKRWGVCICDEGYVAINGRCWACPEGQYSDGIHGCTGCPTGTYKENEADTKCKACPKDSYCVAGKAYACPEHADCSATDFTCTNGYTKTNTECVCGEGKFVDESGVCQECPVYECLDSECCTLTGPVDVCGNPTPTFWGYKNEDGTCYACSVTSSHLTTFEECSKCDNSETPRKIFEYNDRTFCGLVDCGKNYFRGNNGACYECSFELARQASEEECDKCNDTDTPRSMMETTNKELFCTLANCGPTGVRYGNFQSCYDCRSGHISDDSQLEEWRIKCLEIGIPLFRYAGALHSCSEDSSLATTAEDCAMCDGTDYPRYMDGNQCKLCTVEHATACDSDGKATDCKEGYEVKDGKCEQTCLTSGKCTSNEGLCIGYYCKADAEVESNTKTCHTAEGDITHLPQTIPTISENGFTYHISDTTVTWDAAYYYCEAVGTQLAKDVKLAWPKKSDGTDCPASQNCPNWTNTAIYWLNKSEYVKTVTPTPYGNITTTTPGDNLAQPSDDFCYTWAISNKYVRHSMLRTTGEYYYALCE